MLGLGASVICSLSNNGTLSRRLFWDAIISCFWMLGLSASVICSLSKNCTLSRRSFWDAIISCVCPLSNNGTLSWRLFWDVISCCDAIKCCVRLFPKWSCWNSCSFGILQTISFSITSIDFQSLSDESKSASLPSLFELLLVVASYCKFSTSAIWYAWMVVFCSINITAKKNNLWNLMLVCFFFHKWHALQSPIPLSSEKVFVRICIFWKKTNMSKRLRK